MAQESNLCTKCRNPVPFKPRVDVDVRLYPFMSSSLERREIISLCDEDLDDYDAEIIHLQNQIVHLQTQRIRLYDYKIQLQSSFSLFRQLPNEILCIIFESTCTENLLQEFPWPPSHEPVTHLSLPAITYLPALAISAVCTQWRSIALASPRLWSQLRLETGRSEKALDGGFITTLKLYLDRSVDAPLVLNVATQGGRISLYKDRNSRALNLILDHTNRWKTFSYSGDHKLQKLIGFGHSFPILENLTLEGGQWDFKPFEQASKVLTVATSGLVTDLPRSWKSLISLQILRPPGEEEMAALLGYPHLTDLTLLSPWDGFRTDITCLAKLESFTFVESSRGQEETLLDMFSSMTFPSLTELVIDSANIRPSLLWPLDAFSAFISRSMCILTTLSLRFVKFPDQSLIAAFRILPSLAKFAIDDWLGSLPYLPTDSPITTYFISCMHASSSTPILPKLRSLSITTYNPSFDDAAFVDMVSSRWLPGSKTAEAATGIDCLRSLVLHLPRRKVDEETYRPLEYLDRMGMQVVVTGS